MKGYTERFMELQGLTRPHEAEHALPWAAWNVLEPPQDEVCLEGAYPRECLPFFQTAL